MEQAHISRQFSFPSPRLEVANAIVTDDYLDAVAEVLANESTPQGGRLRADIESYIPEVRENLRTLEAWHQVSLFTSVIVPIVGLTVVVLAASFPIGVGVGALCGLPIALTKHLSTHITRTREKLRELYNDLERNNQSERLSRMLNGVSGG